MELTDDKGMSHGLSVRVEGELERIFLALLQRMIRVLSGYILWHVNALSLKLTTVLLMVSPELLCHEAAEASDTPVLLPSVL